MLLSDQLDADLAREFDSLPEPDRVAILAHAEWISGAHPYQIPPPLEQDYHVWMMLAGRGAGKTRSAAEALWWWCWTTPGARGLVLAPTSNDLKFTCFEGVSGLLACIPEKLVSDYNKQDHQIKLVNGSIIRGISADSYERLRGPQFHYAWCDELAAFQYIQEAWDMMQFGLRLGDSPRVIVTTTPRPKDLILELIGREGDDVVIDRASTYDNAENLAPTFRKQLEQYRGSKLYQQEVLGEVVDLEDGKVVSRDMFRLWPAKRTFPKFEYIIQSYDCAFSEKEHNDPTAMTTWGIFKPQDGPMSVLLIDCWAEHLTFPALKTKVLDEWRVSYGEGKEMKRPDLILVEEKAAGISLIQELQKAHLPVRGYNPGKADKMQRLQITAAIFATGRVWLPESDRGNGLVKDWAEGFLSQICSFPDSTHDDYVDSCVVAETQIQMADGVKAIKDIKVGDMVATPAGPRQVTAVHDNGLKEVWDIDGLLATAEHKVMTQDGWTRVDQLIQGVHVLSPFNAPDGVLVNRVINTHTMRHVYDLTVEGEHCYYANGILVHNCTQAMRLLRDMGFLDIDPEPRYDDDDDFIEVRPQRVNPYAE